MSLFARSGSGKWHLAGSDGCRYGQELVATDNPDETVTATDIIAYEPPDERDQQTTSRVTVSLAAGGSSFPRGDTQRQRLVLPAAIEESDSDLCSSCRSTLESHQTRRSKVITGLKLVTTRREIEWNQFDHDHRQACDWCRASEHKTHSGLGARICPSCRRLFETPFGEPSDEDAPDRDRLPETPTDIITPIFFGTTLPDYDPTDLVGSNRPLIKYREKNKYAEIVFELERTGHGFTADGRAELEAIRAEYAESVADTESHQTSVALTDGMTPRTVTFEGILSEDHRDLISKCWGIVSDPQYWFPLGWPQQGYIHRRDIAPSIPGETPVSTEFPRLETQSPSTDVDTATLKSITDSGRYQRGEKYYERGAVTDIERVDNQLHATVQGSRPYDVEATLSDGSYVEGECSCPDDAATCKHIIASVLASGDVESKGDDESLVNVLESASTDELQTLLRSLAEDDIAVRKRIYEELG